MTKAELINAFATEKLIPRDEHEDRIKELADEAHKLNFSKSELQKMPKDVIMKMSWAIGRHVWSRNKKEAIKNILEVM